MSGRSSIRKQPTSSGSGGDTGGLIKPYSEERLPSAIRELDGKQRQIYIMLRLRKTEQQIAGELRLKPEETRFAIDEVRHRLGREGMLYLVEDPEMVSLHGETSDDPDIPMPSPALDIESRLIIKEFIRALRGCLETLPPDQATLLRLRYRNDMTAGEIVDFLGRTGVSVIPGKASAEVTEQDVYYGISSALIAVLKQLQSKYKGEYGTGIDHLKMIFEEFEI